MDSVLNNRFLNTLPYSLFLLGVVLIALAAFNHLVSVTQTKTTPVSSPAQSWAPTDLLLGQLQQRLRDYPADPETYVRLGGAYLQKVRETGDPSYYARGEKALLKALELDSDNAQAMTLLGALALGRHEFQEAVEWAERSLEISPAYASAYGVLGDGQLELGQYEAAFASLQRMVDLKPNLDSYARVSYVRELTGDVEGAIEAMHLAVANGPPGTEGTAWARVQLGDLYFNSGRTDEAAEQYQAALTEFNGYYLALASLGKARAAQGDYGEAIDLLEQAVAVIPQPATLATLGDLYSLTGQPDKAQLQYDTVEIIAQLAAVNQQVYNRELALFYADHDLKLDSALELSEKELEVRRDIYGYDALAWSLFKNNRPGEAVGLINQAMRLGTQDASIFFHAGMIYHKLGDLPKARFYLDKALDLNPHFSLLHSDRARSLLQEINQKLEPSPETAAGVVP
jgi:tetratricopeptide (TPR) repeat protein